MSGDPLSTFGPSDSGFLNSFRTPNPSAPLRSRVGEELPADPLAGSDSVLEQDDPSEEDTLLASEVDADGGPSDAQLDEMLRTTPIPEGLVARVRRRFEEEGRRFEEEI